jgi:hypothetical protein
LRIEGRQFGLPLSDFDVKAIIAKSHRAPCGKGAETLANEEVHRNWEIDGRRIKLRHPNWPTVLDGIVSKVCKDLQIAGGTAAVDAQLDRLLVHEEGAMSKPHKELVPSPLKFVTC